MTSDRHATPAGAGSGGGLRDHTTIRWGIIGCGDVTEVKSGPGFQKAEGSRLVAVMRRNGALARHYALRHGVPRWYDDADALIGDPEVDAVYVATPPDSHHDYVLRCAAARKPVYVEKPMAMHAGECESMIDACRAAGVRLFTAYYRRAMPKFTRIKALVDEGTIGDVRAVSTVLYQSYAPPAGTVPWRVDPHKAGGGLFVDLAPHTLDFLDHVLGPITDVAGAAGNQAGRYRAEDIVSMRFAFGSGVQGVGLWAFSLGTSLDRTELLGSHGRIAFSTFGDDPIVVETGDGTESIVVARPEHVQQPLIQTVVDDLLGRGYCPSTGESALRTTRVTDAALRSYYAPPTPDAP